MKIIGIDPGIKTGVAVYDKTLGRLVDVFITDFWGAYEYTKDNQHDILIQKVIIEVPQTKFNWHKSQHSTTSANVGGIYREANLLADGIEKLGIKVIRQHPQGKTTHDQIKRLTGWNKPTNEHTRDAIMLCWGY